jgi:uncharacterized protein YndB with AHSA1/START domain
MNQHHPETQTVIVEREFAHPPEKDLASAHPTAPHRGVADEKRLRSCGRASLQYERRLGRSTRLRILELEPNETLSYSWNFSHSDPAFDLRSVVTFTLEPSANGTRLRMEQTGFRPDQKQASGGARFGWQNFFGKLDQLLTRLA